MKYIVYGKENCSYCNLAKDLLSKNGVAYDYIDVSVQANRDELLSLAESIGVTVSTVPQIFQMSWEGGDTHYVGGYKELSYVLK